MNENFALALQITLIGMTLVFASLVLLWGLMALLMRLFVEPESPAPASTPAQEVARVDRERELASVAAAIAVATALQQEASQKIAAPSLGTASLSPWQAARRADQLRKGGRKR